MGDSEKKPRPTVKRAIEWMAARDDDDDNQAAGVALIAYTFSEDPRLVEAAVEAARAERKSKAALAALTAKKAGAK